MEGLCRLLLLQGPRTGVGAMTTAGEQRPLRCLRLPSAGPTAASLRTARMAGGE